MTNSKANYLLCLHSAFLVFIPPLVAEGNMVTPVTCDRFVAEGNMVTPVTCDRFLRERRKFSNICKQLKKATHSPRCRKHVFQPSKALL